MVCAYHVNVKTVSWKIRPTGLVDSHVVGAQSRCGGRVRGQGKDLVIQFSQSLCLLKHKESTVVSFILAVRDRKTSEHYLVWQPK
jgi:hypothetical protein